jgi:hypothetical protein
MVEFREPVEGKLVVGLHGDNALVRDVSLEGLRGRVVLPLLICSQSNGFIPTRRRRRGMPE